MKIIENLDLTPYNSYRLYARCARAFFPDTEEEVREAYRMYPEQKKILIGSGHNIILAREWYDEDFIILNGNFDRIIVKESVMEAEAGAFSTTMSEVALAHGLSGLEVFYDIPSSLGGAVVMNAGAGGEEIKDLLIRVRYLDLSNFEFREIESIDADLSYRNSAFQRDASKVILRAWLQLKEGQQSSILDKMNAIKATRWAKQPREFPNAGSVFKRPPGRYVGPMIDELNLKGCRVRGVEVSEKHGGFIVKKGDATGGDVVELIQYIRGVVYDRYQVNLEVEQRIIS